VTWYRTPALIPNTRKLGGDLGEIRAVADRRAIRLGLENKSLPRASYSDADRTIDRLYLSSTV